MLLYVTDRLEYRYGWNSIRTCIPGSHLCRVTYARCIDTIDSPDVEHMVARNMQSIEINIDRQEMCVKLIIYKNNTVYVGGLFTCWLCDVISLSGNGRNGSASVE